MKEYHKRYTKFESLLYGASSYYRDHVFHAIRTWMLGVFCMLKSIQKGKQNFIDFIKIDGFKGEEFTKDINFFEKLSMWTIIALCHDLGYPLEKSQQILDRTRDMMKEFIQNPNIWNNFGFSGIQDSINEYIVKFISTNMKYVVHDDQMIENSNSQKYDENLQDRKFIGRVQPKYFLKYTKSLERFDHGIVSAVIIYKMLLYFLESDFNLNDDYSYTYEDARQFYIRREILRAISSHTCSDVYNIHLTTFSSLLFLCDELQEWGRKSWNDLYAGLLPDAIKLTITNFIPTEIIVSENIDMSEVHERQIIINNIIGIFERQYSYYKLIFRDGQYTRTRDFAFIKNVLIQLNGSGTLKNLISIQYTIKSEKPDFFCLDISKAPSYRLNFKSDIENLLKDTLYYDELQVKE